MIIKNFSLQGTMPNLQGSNPPLQPARTPRPNIGGVLQVQPGMPGPRMQPAVQGPRIQPAISGVKVQPSVGGVPQINPANPPAPQQSYGFTDGTAYNAQGQQTQAPQITPEQYATAMHVALNTPVPGSASNNTGSLGTGNPTIEPANIPSTQPVQPSLSKYEQDVRDAMGLSPEEVTANEELNRLRESTKLGFYGKEGQGRGIPLELVRGQQEKLLQQAELTQQTLQQKLALAQAKRTAAFDASKFALERQDKKKDAEKPLEVGGNLVRLNPTTGKYESVFSAPKTGDFSMGFDPISGGAYVLDKNTGKITPGSSGGSNLVDNLIAQIQSNPQVFGQLGTAQQNAVIARMGELGLGIPTDTKPATDAQNTSATYGLRIKQSDDVIGKIEQDIVNFNPARWEIEARSPNFLKSDVIQNYEQAARNFINAQLRRESGAVISPSEFENAYKQYLPRPGDNPQVIAQKRANRETALRGLINSSGPAWNNLTGGNTSGSGSVDDIIRKYLPSFNGDLSKSGNGSVVLGSNLARQNNNPGNLRYVGQPGAQPGAGGFARFSTPQAGIAALKAQIALDASRGHTLASFINKYAPPSENNTTLYIQQMAKAVGANANTPISRINLDTLAKAMAIKESNSRIG